MVVSVLLLSSSPPPSRRAALPKPPQPAAAARLFFQAVVVVISSAPAPTFGRKHLHFGAAPRPCLCPKREAVGFSSHFACPVAPLAGGARGKEQKKRRPFLLSEPPPSPVLTLPSAKKKPLPPPLPIPSTNPALLFSSGFFPLARGRGGGVREDPAGPPPLPPPRRSLLPPLVPSSAAPFSRGSNKKLLIGRALLFSSIYCPPTHQATHTRTTSGTEIPLRPAVSASEDTPAPPHRTQSDLEV